MFRVSLSFFQYTVSNFSGTKRDSARPGAPGEVHELRHGLAGHGGPPQPLVQGHQGVQAPQAWREEKSDPPPPPPSCLAPRLLSLLALASDSEKVKKATSD